MDIQRSTFPQIKVLTRCIRVALYGFRVGTRAHVKTEHEQES